jgi:hypothetical protein
MAQPITSDAEMFHMLRHSREFELLMKYVENEIEKAKDSVFTLEDPEAVEAQRLKVVHWKELFSKIKTKLSNSTGEY